MMLTKFYTLIGDNQPHKFDVIVSFQSAAKCDQVRKTDLAGQSLIFQPLFNLKSSYFANHSMPTIQPHHHHLLPVVIYRSLKTAKNALGLIYPKLFESEITKFYTLVVDYQPHKRVGYDVTAVSSWMQSAIKYCTEVRKTAGQESNNSATI